ncbi:MAG: hypothetical protein ACREEB_13150 [Caulobacteraceae bacterium]
MNLSVELSAYFYVLRNKFEDWATGELLVVEAAGSAILAGLQTVAVAAKPAAVSDIIDILQTLPAEFLSGSTLDVIAEEVLKQSEADTATILKGIAPQVLATLIGILIKGL